MYIADFRLPITSGVEMLCAVGPVIGPRPGDHLRNPPVNVPVSPFSSAVLPQVRKHLRDESGIASRQQGPIT